MNRSTITMKIPSTFDACFLFVALVTAARVVHGRVGAPHGQTFDELDFPIVASASFLGGPADADAALSGTDLDSLDRGEREGPDGNGGIIRRFLLHSNDDVSSMEKAMERAEEGGTWVLDEERTERIRAVVADIESSEQAGNRELSAAGYQTISGFSCYRTVDGTIQTMLDIAAAYPHLATIETIGQSYQGRDMFVLKLTDKNSSSKKAPLFITAGIHAREYTPVELVTRFAEHLVENYGENADIDGILAHTEFHISAVSNPDGRTIAQSNRNLWWRKNGNKDKCSGGKYGVDLNRNFDYMWGGVGAATDPCATSYRGASAGSESETAAIMKYSESIFPPGQRKSKPVKDVDEPYDEWTSTGMYLDVHSSGRDIIFPWGHKNVKVGNFQGYQAISHKICSINGYQPSGSGNYRFLGTVAGDTLDYHYGKLGVASILFELGTEFYQKCDVFESEILPDNLQALLYASKLVHRPYELPKGPDVTSLSVPQGPVTSRTVVINARVSDQEMTKVPNFPALSTGNQKIASVRLFVGGHPYEQFPPQALPMSPANGKSAFDSHTVDATLTLDVSDLAGKGPQMICVVGTDAAGYKGPVSCEYLTVAPRTTTTTASPQSPAAAKGQTEPTPASPAAKPQSSTTTTTQQTPASSPAKPQTTTTTTTPAAIQKPKGRGSQSCPKQDTEGDCEKLDGCKWKKDECMDVCAGKNKEDKCTKVGACAWDGKAKLCSRRSP